MKKTLISIFLFISSTSFAEWSWTSFTDELTDEKSFLIVTETGEGVAKSALAIKFTPPKLKTYPSLKTLLYDNFPKSLFKVIGKPEIHLIPAHERFLDDVIPLKVRFGSHKPMNLLAFPTLHRTELTLKDSSSGYIFSSIMISDKVVFRYDNHETKTISFDTSGMADILDGIIVEAYPENMKRKPADAKEKPVCQTCNNVGKVSKHVKCTKCHGSGTYKESRRSGKMSYSIEMPCDRCKKGQMLKPTTCPDCKNQRN